MRLAAVTATVALCVAAGACDAGADNATPGGSGSGGTGPGGTGSTTASSGPASSGARTGTPTSPDGPRAAPRGGSSAASGPASPIPATPTASELPPGGGGSLTFAYGPARAQTTTLLLPTEVDATGPPDRAPRAVPIVVLIHGGAWKAAATTASMTALASDLTARGVVVWSMDYRGVGADSAADEGGWPRTYEDVAAGLDLLPRALAGVGLTASQVAVVGHSAGGPLALWLAARGQGKPGLPGGPPAVRPTVAVSLAGADDFEMIARATGPSGFMADFMGGMPADKPAEYAHASPSNLVPIGVPMLFVVGSIDPLESVAKAIAQTARGAGDDVRLEVIEGAGHIAPIVPTSAAWLTARTWLAGHGFG